MKKEIKPLSEKIRKIGISPKNSLAIKMSPFLFVEDVKEFIEQINKSIANLDEKEFTRGRCISIINLNAGKELID